MKTVTPKAMKIGNEIQKWLEDYSVVNKITRAHPQGEEAVVASEQEFGCNDRIPIGTLLLRVLIALPISVILLLTQQSLGQPARDNLNNTIPTSGDKEVNERTNSLKQSGRSSVKRVGEDVWVVELVHNDRWFETGIPIAVNQEAVINSTTTTETWETKITGLTKPIKAKQKNAWGGERYYTLMFVSEVWGDAEYFVAHDTYNGIYVPLDYCGTIKFRADPANRTDVLTLTVSVYDDHIYRPADDRLNPTPGHLEMHEKAKRKAEALRARFLIKR
jgi:hypothetical protein